MMWGPVWNRQAKPQWSLDNVMADQSARPNLIVITTDQQRFDAAGIYGNRMIQTPHIDRLGSEGVVFERGYCASPVCVPTRASLVTGHCAYHPRRFERFAVNDPADTVPSHLKAAGYRTHGIGKFHFAPVRERRLNGFDSLVLSEEMRGVRTARTADEVWLDDYDQYLVEHGLWGWEKPPEIGYNEIKPLVNHLPPEHHVTQWCGDRTVQWLRDDAPRDQPFFLWTSFVKPHAPYDAPAHLKDLYDPAALPDPWCGQDDVESNPHYAAVRRKREWHLYSEESCRLARAYYYANVTFIDQQIGRILDALEEGGFRDNTIILFTSDHGDLLGDHGMWFKSMGFEGSVRVPLIMWGPGHIAGGQRVDRPASHYDIAQTLLDLGGAVVAMHERPGVDLRELAAGRIDRDLVVSMQTGLYVCHRDWKYNFYPNGGFEELFDLRTDPRECHNLAADAAHTDIKRQLRAALIHWLGRYAGGYGLDPAGELASRLYSEKEEVIVNPHSRMPWESRIPPAVLQGKGTPPPSWWWRDGPRDFARLLPESLT